MRARNPLWRVYGNTFDALRSLDKITNKRWIPSLDGLRGVAVCLVVTAHLQLFRRLHDLLQTRHMRIPARVFAIDPGDLGVSLFFVISGFIITTLLIREEEGGGISLKRFYLRRAFRIFPPYYAYLFGVVFLWHLNVVHLAWGSIITALTYTSNYYPYRVSHPESTGWLLGHTWSLSLEEQFYCFWPLCLCWLGKKKAMVVGVFLLVVVPVVRVLTLHVSPSLGFDQQIYRMFHTRIDTIMTGCILALSATWEPFHRALSKAVAKPWSLLAACCLLVVNLEYAVERESFWTLLGISVEGLLLAYIVACLMAQADGAVGRTINQPLLRHVGQISFSLYLWQQLYTGPSTVLTGHRSVVATVVLATISAELSYFLIERNSFVLRDKLLSHLAHSR